MTSAQRFTRAAMALLLLSLMGCTALREIPRSQYAAQGERRNVAIDTHEGLHYEFDLVRVGSDSLTGFRRRDTEGPLEEFDALPLPLEAIAKMSARRVDWYRTGLIGGAGLAAIIASALARRGTETIEPISPCGPRGCPE
jgi:hypothetical protein